MKNREKEINKRVTDLNLYLKPKMHRYNLRSSFAVGSPSPCSSEVEATGEALAQGTE